MPRAVILTLENKSHLDNFFCIDAVKSVFKDYIKVFGDDYALLPPLPELEKMLKEKGEAFESVSCEICMPGKIINGYVYKMSRNDSELLSTMATIHSNGCKIKENVALYKIDLNFKSFIIHIMLLYQVGGLQHVDNFFWNLILDIFI